MRETEDYDVLVLQLQARTKPDNKEHAKSNDN